MGQDEQPSAARPFYEVIGQERAGHTSRYMVTCDEGWRKSIVCRDMYEWAADWLVGILQGQPYAPAHNL